LDFTDLAGRHGVNDEGFGSAMGAASVIGCWATGVGQSHAVFVYFEFTIEP
jgi:hypothetical protein